MLSLYHGSTAAVPKVDLACGRSDVDFGQGFYLTTLYDQARRWAERRYIRARDAHAIVNEYAYDTDNDLQILRFDGYSEEWLDFVVGNRRSEARPLIVTYDVVIGNVADDDVVNAIDRYIAQLEKGQVTRNTKLALLDELRFACPNDQYCFKTERALEFLNFKEAKVVDDG
jgi:hypothetical protein